MTSAGTIYGSSANIACATKSAISYSINYDFVNAFINAYIDEKIFTKMLGDSRSGTSTAAWSRPCIVSEVPSLVASRTD